VNGELIDLSLHGAAVIHRSPVKAGSSAPLIFPSYGRIYVPPEGLRSTVQVRRGDKGPEYVFRSAISFNAIPTDQEASLREFLEIQIKRLEEKRQELSAES